MPTVILQSLASKPKVQYQSPKSNSKLQVSNSIKVQSSTANYCTKLGIKVQSPISKSKVQNQSPIQRNLVDKNRLAGWLKNFWTLDFGLWTFNFFDFGLLKRIPTGCRTSSQLSVDIFMASLDQK